MARPSDFVSCWEYSVTPQPALIEPVLVISPELQGLVNLGSTWGEAVWGPTGSQDGLSIPYILRITHVRVIRPGEKARW